MSSTSLAIAQVGINTANPTATLDVNGNMKLRAANTATGSNFSAMVRDNSTGELKVANNSPQFLVGGTLGDQIPTTFRDVAEGTAITQTLGTYAFTLTRPSMVNISASVQANATISGSNLGLTDGSARGMTLSFDFSAAPAGIPLSTPFGSGSLIHLNSVSSTLVLSGSDISANSILSLPAGNYTLRLLGLAEAGKAFRATFGRNTNDMIQIVATPL
ncbi:hypothetical protein [Chryseobacterium glaciei]|uniref:hypothetical protein n=1 Tax=Chryseobacterium glaciei TaxID=1685010 RepID=UPI0012FFB26B|nr:hypothetical protein [Chryseobacterium glaciei]